MFRRIGIIAIALLLAGAPALAGGKLEVVQQIMNAYDSYGSVYVDVYAEVRNAGDSNVEFSAGLLELLDADGNTLDSNNYPYCYPSVLAPGETGYVIVSMFPENAKAASDVANYNLTVTGKDSKNAVTPLKSSGSYDADVADGYWTYDYLTAVITNESGEIVYDYYTVYAVKDAAGALIYATYYSVYAVGIPAGGSVYVRTYIPDSALAMFDAKGFVPATVETISYVDPY